MLKLAWSYIKGYKKNSLICIMGIAFSVMLMFSLSQMSSSIVNYYKDMLLGKSTYDVMFRNITGEQLDDIYAELENEECDKAKMLWYGQAFFETGISRVNVIGAEGEWNKILNLELIQGKLPKDDYEICVEEKYSKLIGASVGDKVELELLDDLQNKYKVTFEICGIISNTPTPYADYYVYSTADTAKKVMAREGYVSEDANNSIMALWNRYTYEEEKIMDCIRNVSVKYDNKFYKEKVVLNNEKIEMVDEKSAYSGVSTGLYCMVAFLFVCMTVFIYNAINISMIEKIRQYGILRCVGMNVKKVVSLLLCEVTFYTASGIVIGILGGNVLNGVVADKILNLLMPIKIDIKNHSAETYIIICVLACLAVLTAIAGTFFSILRKNPMEMMQYRGKQGKVKKGKDSKSLVYGMAKRNLVRNKSKVRILTVTITLVSLLIMLMGNAITSIKITTAKTIYSFADFEVFANRASETPYIYSNNIKDLLDFDDIEAVYWQAYENDYKCVAEGLSGVEFLIYSDNLMEKFIEYNHLAIDDYKNSNVAILVTDKNLPKDISIKVTATEYLKERYEDSKQEYIPKITKTISKESEILAGQSVPVLEDTSYLIINEALAEVLLGEKVNTYSTVFVEQKNNIEISDIQRLLADLDCTVTDMRDVRIETQKQITGLLALAAYLLIAVLVLSLFIIINTIKANFNQRMNEIGMLRSIGSEKKFVSRLLSLEIMIVSLRGLISAGIIALPVSMYIYYSVNERMGMGVLGYILAIPCVLCGCYFISHTTVKNCLKTKTTELLRYE